VTKKNLPTLVLVLLAVSLGTGGASQPAAQGADVSLQTVEPFAYFCLPVKGSYSKNQ